MWKLWKSASSPYVASKTALENVRENRRFSMAQFTLSGCFLGAVIPFRFGQGDFLPISRQNRSTNTMNKHEFQRVFHSFHRVWETFCGKQK
jgi:hypothetical protein